MKGPSATAGTFVQLLVWTSLWFILGNARSLRSEAIEDTHSWSCFLFEPSEVLANPEGNEVQLLYSSKGARDIRNCFDLHFQENPNSAVETVVVTYAKGVLAEIKSATVTRSCTNSEHKQLFYSKKSTNTRQKYTASKQPNDCRSDDFGSITLVVKGDGVASILEKKKYPTLRVGFEPSAKQEDWQCSLVTATQIEKIGSDELTFSYVFADDSRTKECIDKYLRKYTNGYLRHVAVTLDDEFVRLLELDSSNMNSLAFKVEGSGVHQSTQLDVASSYHTVDLSANREMYNRIVVNIKGTDLVRNWEASSSSSLREGWLTPRLRMLYKA